MWMQPISKLSLVIHNFIYGIHPTDKSLCGARTYSCTCSLLSFYVTKLFDLMNYVAGKHQGTKIKDCCKNKGVNNLLHLTTQHSILWSSAPVWDRKNGRIRTREWFHRWFGQNKILSCFRLSNQTYLFINVLSKICNLCFCK